MRKFLVFLLVLPLLIAGLSTLAAPPETIDASGNVRAATATNPGAVSTGAQTFAGVKTFSDGVKIGSGGTTIAASIRATQAIDFGNLVTNACLEQAITVTGAAVGAECSPSLPPAMPAQVITTCHVESTNTVHLHICNFGTAHDPASLTYSVRVFNP